MNREKFYEWSNRFNGDIKKFHDDICELKNLYEFVAIIRLKTLAEIKKYVYMDWKPFGYRKAWFGIDKLEKKIKWAEKKINFLANIIELGEPNLVPYLALYLPALESWEILMRDVRIFEKIVGVYDSHVSSELSELRVQSADSINYSSIVSTLYSYLDPLRCGYTCSRSHKDKKVTLFPYYQGIRTVFFEHKVFINNPRNSFGYRYHLVWGSWDKLGSEKYSETEVY